MTLIVQPSKRGLRGSITPPGSKSYSHRAFILAGLAKGTSTIKNALTSGDVSITINILSKLGIRIEKQANKLYEVHGLGEFQKDTQDIIDCGNSGTSVRIFSALSLLIEGGLQLKGEFFRRNRPITPLLEALREIGASYSLTEKNLSIYRQEKRCRDIKIRGDISSQFITALLIVCSTIKCTERTQINVQLTTSAVSYPYLKITVNILERFGIQVREYRNDGGFLVYSVKTGQKIQPRTYEIPSDFSSAAFIIAAAVLSPYESKVSLSNLDFGDPQGDKRIIDILKGMGANIKKEEENMRVICYGNRRENPLEGLDIDCKNIPDLFPILSVIGAFAEGKTVLYNAENLRLKESDRISIMARELTKMGVKVEEMRDKLVIYHCDELKGAKIDHNGDHRVAMACCIAALYATSESHLEHIDVVDDSYPEFIEDLKQLGTTALKVK